MGVMAKAPLPGRAKTRLCPPLRPAQAAALSAAFLRDITENIALAARTPIHGYVAYAPRAPRARCRTCGREQSGAGRRIAAGAMDVQGFGRCLLHAAYALFARVRRRLSGEPDSPTCHRIIRRTRAADAAERIVLARQRMAALPAA
jgi:hypothetical protein